jgi:hypothetical protein
VAFDAAGEAIAVWESFAQPAPLTWGVFGRRVGVTGAPLGTEFAMAAAVPLNDQRRPSVARQPGGGFIVVWDAPTLGLLPSIVAQRFNATGAPLGPAISVALGTVLQAKANAGLAVDADGRFAVVWESTNQDALFTSGVYARLYSSSGTPLTNEFAVNTTTAGDQVHPVAGFDNSGNLIVAWSGQGTGDASGVFYRVFNQAGGALTGELLANGTTAGTQFHPTLATLPGGTSVIAWSGAGSGDASGVFARRLNAAWSPIGPEVLVNSDSAGTQDWPTVAADPDGDFIIVWSGEGSGDPDGVFAREFSQDGIPRAPQMLMNQMTAGTQGVPSASAAGDNTYLVIWSGAGAGDSAGVFGRMLADEPAVLTTNASALLYTENDAPTAVDPSLGVSDADDATVAWAAVSITAGYALGQDVLAFADQSEITGSWDPATGILLLSGSASVAAYQAALRTVTYVNLSDDPSTLPRTVTFIVNDGALTGVPAARTISVSAVNDPPLVITSAGNAVYTEGGAPARVDPDLIVGDADSPLLSAATVRIEGGFALGEDLLSFTGTAGIVGLWNPLTGVLTLTGPASVSSYEAALRSITYSNLSANPTTGPRAVSFAAWDGSAWGQPVSRSVQVSAANDPPTVLTSVGSAVFTESGPPVPLDPAVTITDPDSATLAGATVRLTTNYASGQDILLFGDQHGIFGVWDPSTGTLTLSGVASLANYTAALRSIAYQNTSDAPSVLVRTVSISVTDGVASSAPATRTLLVVGINDRPVVATSPGAALFTEDGPAVAVDPGLTLSDPDSPLMAGATISITANFAASDTLLFTNQAGIVGVWNALTGVLTLSGVASLAAYQAALRAVQFRTPGDDPGTSPRTISFSVTDGVDFSVPATRQVGVSATNDAPAVATSPGFALYAEGGPLVPIDPLLMLTDADDDVLWGATVSISAGYAPGEDFLSFRDQFGISGFWDAGAGLLTLSGPASLALYTLALRSILFGNGSESPDPAPRTVTFLVFDGVDQSGAVGRALTVVPINDPPVLTASSGAATYRQAGPPVPIDPGIGVVDPDSGSIHRATVTIVGNFVFGDMLAFTDQSGISGSWDALTGILTLTGVASVAEYQTALRSVLFAGNARLSPLARTVTFRVDDGSDSSLPAARQVAISLNQPPAISASSGSATFVENAAGVSVDPALVVVDAEGDPMSRATARIVSGYQPGADLLVLAGIAGLSSVWDEATGTLTLSGSATAADYERAFRQIAFVNLSDDPGSAERTVAFVVDDGFGESAAARRSIVVIPVNDAPVLGLDTAALQYTQSGRPALIDPTLSLDDPDSATLIGASARILGEYSSTEETLTATAQAGITLRWDAQRGILTLTGRASLAAYQAVLRTVAYVNVSSGSGSRTISVTVDDGSDTAVAGRTIELNVSVGGGDGGGGGGAGGGGGGGNEGGVDDGGSGSEGGGDDDGGGGDSSGGGGQPGTGTGGGTVIHGGPVGGPNAGDETGEPGPTPGDSAAGGPAIGQDHAAGSVPAAAERATTPGRAPTAGPTAARPSAATNPPATVQVLELTPRAPRSTVSLLRTALGRPFTVVAIGTGGTLLAGYAVWLAINYSLARHTLLLLPRYTPMDVHCLLRLASRRPARIGARS